MTQEFEKWCRFENLGVSPDLNASHVRAAKAAWQTSREQLKAKLLSDEMVEVVAGILAIHLFADFTLTGSGGEQKYRAIIEHNAEDVAKAALQAVVGEL